MGLCIILRRCVWVGFILDLFDCVVLVVVDCCLRFLIWWLNFLCIFFFVFWLVFVKLFERFEFDFDSWVIFFFLIIVGLMILGLIMILVWSVGGCCVIGGVWLLCFWLVVCWVVVWCWVVWWRNFLILCVMMCFEWVIYEFNWLNLICVDVMFYKLICGDNFYFW